LVAFLEVQNAKTKNQSTPGGPTVIQIGLFFSVIGDLLLIFGENGKSPLFIPGVFFFALAQVFYIMSFGWNVIQMQTLMFVSFAFYSATNIVFADVKDEKLKAILTGYAVLLGTEIHRFTCQENT